MKKIYGINLEVKQSYTSYIYAESKAEAEEKAEAIYNHNSDALATEWGSQEIDHTIEASAEPYPAGMNLADYRGDGVKIAEENEGAHAEAIAEAE